MEGYLGQIIMFAGNFAPQNWAFCHGQLLAINQYQALFSIIGTTYGGDGRTTFGLPDLRGRAPISAGQAPGLPNYRQGDRGGQPTATLLPGNLPPHSHQVSIATAGAAADDASPGGRLLATAAVDAYSQTPGGAPLAGVSEQAVGQGLPLATQSPYTVVNFIICLFGIFPARG